MFDNKLGQSSKTEIQRSVCFPTRLQPLINTIQSNIIFNFSTLKQQLQHHVDDPVSCHRLNGIWQIWQIDTNLDLYPLRNSGGHQITQSASFYIMLL